MSATQIPLPRSFVMRRIHSLLGLWIVLFLIEHLITNSQAALFIGESGAGFIRAVNFIKNLPYLPVIEAILLGVPILYHMFWGLSYLFSAKINAFPSNGAHHPSLTRYGRNHAYTWQRITSWILFVGLLAHVGSMRFYRYPAIVKRGMQEVYFVKVSMDPGLYTVSNRLGVSLYNEDKIEALRKRIQTETAELNSLSKEVQGFWDDRSSSSAYLEKNAELALRYQTLQEGQLYLQGIEKRALSEGEVIAVAEDFGTATLLLVRDSFKSLFQVILYTVFVLAAVFHAFNGLWTFLITWGIVIRMRSQSRAVNGCMALMALMGFLGLAAVWGTYYLNLRR